MTKKVKQSNNTFKQKAFLKSIVKLFDVYLHSLHDLSAIKLGVTMMIKKLKTLLGTKRDVDWGNGQSRRLLLERDGKPYSVTDTVVNAGSESLLQYKSHQEACYCIEGEGEVVSSGTTFRIAPGVLYAPEKGETHVLRAKTKLRLVCVFTPALTGNETHKGNLDGRKHSSY